MANKETRKFKKIKNRQEVEEVITTETSRVIPLDGVEDELARARKSKAALEEQIAGIDVQIERLEAILSAK